eukprot:1685524-Rhodomonas_salina.2
MSNHMRTCSARSTAGLECACTAPHASETSPSTLHQYSPRQSPLLRILGARSVARFSAYASWTPCRHATQAGSRARCQHGHPHQHHDDPARPDYYYYY